MKIIAILLSVFISNAVVAADMEYKCISDDEFVVYLSGDIDTNTGRVVIPSREIDKDVLFYMDNRFQYRWLYNERTRDRKKEEFVLSRDGNAAGYYLFKVGEVAYPTIEFNCKEIDEKD